MTRWQFEQRGAAHIGSARRTWARVARHVPVEVRGSARLFKRLLVDHGYLRAARQKASVDRTGSPVPWYTFPAFEYLDQLDFRGKRVFEYGSGNSTLWWASRADSVKAVENDADWYERVKGQIDPSRVTYELAPDRDAYVNAVAVGGPWDVIVVDGYWRGMCAEAGLPHLNDGGMVILDNSEWMPDVAAMLRDADLIEVDFSGFGTLADHSSTTSLFLHRSASFPPRTGAQPGLPRGGMPIPEWRWRWLMVDPDAKPDDIKL